MLKKITLQYDNALVSFSEIECIGKKLKPYITHLSTIAEDDDYSFDESSIFLPSDEKLLDKVMRLHDKKVSGALKYVIVIGIGGSNLGTKAIYESLLGYDDGFNNVQYPKIIFVDTNDAEFLRTFGKFLSLHITSSDEFLVCSISKSGGTTETIANTEYIMDIFSRKFKDAQDRLVIITDVVSKFQIAAQKKGIATLSIPKNVGGRYSVLSAVGLFPLACAGIDILKLREGAEFMRTKCLSENIFENPAAMSAIILFHHYKNKKSINDNFIFHPELESIGKWYRQLMGESVGKEKDIHGNVVHVGLTPTVSVGSTDLHSVGQLYLGGPKDKITTFIRTESEERDVIVPKNQIFPDLVSGISGKSMTTIMRAILNGVKIAYTKNELPFMEIVFPEISEYTLGQFLQFKMIEIMYLGNLMEVHTFNQPNVESYKVETKKILGG